MKALLRGIVVLAALGGIGYAAYYFVFDQQTRACGRLAELCGADKGADAEQKCEQFFAKIKEVSGDEGEGRSVACIQESKSCAAAMGCMLGAGLGAAGQFLEGVKRALQDK